MTQPNLDTLDEWCQSTENLHLVVRYYGAHTTQGKWCIRVCPNWAGMSHPVLTMHGDCIETLSLSALPIAQQRYTEQEKSIRTKNQQAARNHSGQMRRERKEIERMNGVF